MMSLWLQNQKYTFNHLLTYNFQILTLKISWKSILIHFICFLALELFNSLIQCMINNVKDQTLLNCLIYAKTDQKSLRTALELHSCRLIFKIKKSKKKKIIHESKSLGSTLQPFVETNVKPNTLRCSIYAYKTTYKTTYLLLFLKAFNSSFDQLLA